MSAMAWRDSLFDCSFRGVVFDVIGTRDAYSRAVSVGEFPYRDGGETEDLGARPARFSLQAVFFGDDYEARLHLLLEALAVPGPGELMHPVWGSIQLAQLNSFEVTHAAPEPDACTVSLEFTESSVKAPFFVKMTCYQVQETVGAPGDLALDASVEAVGSTVDALRAANPLAMLDGLRQAMLGPMLSLTAEVQGIVTSGLDVLAYPRAWARDVATLSNGLLDIASFPDKLMADWRAITGTFARIGAQWGYGTAGSSATAYVWPAAAPNEAQAQGVVRVHLAVVNATTHAEVAAMVLAEEAIAPTLTPPEIETVVGAARAEIDAAMLVARAALPLEQSRSITEALKSQALAIQEAGRALIELRPPMLRRSLEAHGNLRLIAHRWYGDHARASELARLNPSLRRPNALQPGDVLDAYAR
jgi:prophage DNA circulation protein